MEWKGREWTGKDSTEGTGVERNGRDRKGFKGNNHNPDACLDSDDLKAIAESEEDIRAGRVYTHEEIRTMFGFRKRK